MLMDLFFAASAVRAQAPRAFPRVHGRRARAPQCRAAGDEGRPDRGCRSDPPRRRRARRGSLAALLRRIPRHRHRRRDDPRTAVHAPVRAGRRRGRDLECRAGRALQGRAQPRAVPAVHRAAARAHGGRAAAGAEGLPAGEAQRPAGVVRAGGRGRRSRARHGVAALHRHAVGRAACEIAAKGRVIRVPEAAKGVARFSFRQLCEQPLGASDYLRIAHEFHTIILERSR